MFELIRFIKKKKCTATTLGEIVDMYAVLKNLPTIIHVEYIVNDKTYVKIEEVKTKTKMIIKEDHIEEKEYPCIGNHKIGDLIHICYNPNKPKSSFIKENNYV